MNPIALQNSKGDPSAGAINTRGWGKFAIFDRNRRLPQKRYDVGSWLLLLLLFISHKMQHKKTHIIQIQHTSKTNKKGEMQSADKTTIKAKVHVYVSTTVLANDIQILRFISYRDSERELMSYLEATASISFCFAVANVLTSKLSLTLAFFPE